MKQNTKLFTILLFLVSLIACNGNDPKKSNESTDKSASLTTDSTDDDNDTTIVIGSVVGGVTSFVADPNTLKSDWEQFIITTQPDLGPCNLTNIEILPNLEGTEYYLVTTGTMTSTGDNLRSVIHLVLTTQSCLSVTGVTMTCTTADCSSEKGACWPLLTTCSPCSGTGKCTRTVSTSPSTIFQSVPTSECPN